MLIDYIDIMHLLEKLLNALYVFIFLLLFIKLFWVKENIFIFTKNYIWNYFFSPFHDQPAVRHSD